MNLKNLLTSLLFVTLLLIGGTLQAQTTWYVNNTNGIDNIGVYSGTTAAQPFKSVTYTLGLAQVVAGDIISIAADNYTESGGQLNVNKAVSIAVTTFNNITTATFPNGVSFNAGASKTVTLTGGTINVGTTAAALYLRTGSLVLNGGSLVVGSGATVTRNNGTISGTPTFGANTNVTYDFTLAGAAVADITAGSELPADLGTGTLTVNDAGKTVTVSSAVKAAAITNTAGTSKFDGGFNTAALTLAAGTVQIGANSTLTGDINNSGTVKLGDFQLTWTPAANLAVTKLGSIVSVTAGTVGNGIVVITGNKSITLDNANGTLPNFSIPANYTNMFSANAGVGVNTLTIDGNFTLASASAGAFTETDDNLSVRGNFNRVDNTPGNFAQGTGTVTLVGGAAQTFNPGASLVLYNLAVNKTAGTTATMSASVEVKKDVTITSGSLDLSDFNVNMTGVGLNQIFNNSGSFYSTTGNGFLVWQCGDDGGGIGVTGQVGTVTGTGKFSNMLINLTDPADFVGTGSNIAFAGTLYMEKGDFRNIGGNTMDFDGSTTPAIANSTVKINTTVANGVAYVNAGTLTYTKDVNLYFFGTGDYGASDIWTAGPTKLNDLTIATTGGNTITGPAAASTISGTLTVNGGQILAQGGQIFTLDGASKTHSIVGSVTGGTLTETGDASSINGTTSTAAGTLATINNLTINVGVGKTFTSSNLKVINGNIVNTSGNSTVTMNATTATLLGSTTLTAGALNLTVAGTTTSDMTTGALQAITVNGGTMTLTRGGAGFAVTGNVNVTAGSLVLGSNVTNNSVTTLSGGNLDLGTYTYTSVYDFNVTAAASKVNGTGWLKLAFSANYNLTAGGADLTLPNLEVAAGANTVTFLGGFNITVTGAFKHTSGVFDFSVAGKNLVLAGPTYTYTAGTYTATGGTGALVFGSTGAATATFAGSVAIPNVTLNADAPVTIASSTATARTLTVGTLFTQTKGDISTGINSITVPTGFTRVAGSWTQGTGYLNLGAAAPTFGTGFAVDNLKITAAVNAGTALFNVNKNLVLANSLTTSADGNMTLGDGIIVERQGNAFTLSKLPTFGATTNVVYGTYSGGVDISTAKELPAAVKNFTVQAGANKVILTKNVNVSGTLSLASMLDATTTASTAITMADNSTLELKANGSTVLDEDLTRAGVLNITYDGATATTTRELLSVTAGAYDNAANGVITFKSGTVLLSANLTLTGSFTFSGGTFDLNGKTLSLNGNVTSATTTTLISSVAGANIAFTGAANTTFGGNYVVPANISITVNKTNADNTVTLTGNMNFATNSKVLTLTKGILVTGTFVVTLEQNVAAGMPTQGYARTSGWVNGNVSKLLKAVTGASPATLLTRVEYPVGMSNYRPMAFQFNTLPTSDFTLTVNQVDANPQGVNGFPITSGSIQLANYPNFYWLVTSDLTLQPQVKYDIEAKAQGYAPSNYPEGVQNVRFLRRFDTNIDNPWVLQGGLGYDNASFDYLGTPAVTTDDGTAIIVRNAEGAISTQGARFTYSQAAKAPTVTTPAAAVTVAENTPLTITWTATSLNLGGTATFEATPVWTATAPAVIPTNATFAAGVLTWTPTYTQAGVYTVKVKAVDGVLSTENTVTITVTNANQAPSFTATGAAVLADASIPYGTAKTFTYVAKDADNEALTYAVNVAPVPAGTVSISNAFGSIGLFTFTPTFADNGKVFVVTVTATDPNAGVATTTANLTVTAAYKRGDATLSGGEPDVTDAIRILEYVVGKATLTAEQLVYADANLDATVGAVDASWVLKYIANNYSWTGVSKVVATAGTVEFSRMSAENGVLSLPFAITSTTGVTSIYAEADLNNANIEVGKVSLRLPEGWLAVTSTENGKVRIAAAGVNAINDGIFATVEVTLKDKETAVSIVGNAKLNDEISSSLSAKVREIPSEFALSQNYPNPFNPTTSIKFSVAQDAKVNLVVYDMLGQRVRTLVDGVQEAGFYTVRWDGSNDFGSKVSSGIYIYRLQAGSFVSTMKMNLMK